MASDPIEAALVARAKERAKYEYRELPEPHVIDYWKWWNEDVVLILFQGTAPECMDWIDLKCERAAIAAYLRKFADDMVTGQITYRTHERAVFLRELANEVERATTPPASAR